MRLIIGRGVAKNFLWGGGQSGVNLAKCGGRGGSQFFLFLFG